MESFLQSQKLSIAKAIRRNFNAYISLKDDPSTQMMTLLGKMFNEQLKFNKMLSDDGDLKVSLNSFREEAKQMNIHEVDRFLKSQVFQARYRIIEGNIVRSIAQS